MERKADMDDDAHITKPELVFLRPGQESGPNPGPHSNTTRWFTAFSGWNIVFWGDRRLATIWSISVYTSFRAILVCILRRLAIPGAWFVAAIWSRLHPVRLNPCMDFGD